MEYVNVHTVIDTRRKECLVPELFIYDTEVTAIKKAFMAGMTGRFSSLERVHFDGRAKVYIVTLARPGGREVHLKASDAVVEFLVKHFTDSTIDAVAVKLEQGVVVDCRLYGRGPFSNAGATGSQSRKEE